jgi:hypothetical protein
MFKSHIQSQQSVQLLHGTFYSGLNKGQLTITGRDDLASRVGFAIGWFSVKRPSF